jgi:hypothetical protein
MDRRAHFEHIEDELKLLNREEEFQLRSERIQIIYFTIFAVSTVVFTTIAAYFI